MSEPNITSFGHEDELARNERLDAEREKTTRQLTEQVAILQKRYNDSMAEARRLLEELRMSPTPAPKPRTFWQRLFRIKP